MAVTATQVGSLPYYTEGHRKVTYTDVTLGATDYPEGGVAVTPEQLRLSAVQHAEAQITVASNSDDSLGACQAVLGTSDGLQTVKIKLYDKDVPAEITADDDVSACVVRVIATGY